MSKTNKLIVITVCVVVVIGGIYFLTSAGFKEIDLTSNRPNQTKETGKANNQQETEGAESATKSAVPQDIKIPGVGEQADSNVAIPSTVSEAAPGATAKFRSFDIKGDKGSFNPSTVIVQKGDTVHINFLAVDKDYDITFPDYGMKQNAKSGETKVLEFQAVTEGKFAYYCDACGGLDGTAKGYIIVAP